MLRKDWKSGVIILLTVLMGAGGLIAQPPPLQVTVQGQVTDVAAAAPIVGATVTFLLPPTMEPTLRGAQTDEEGGFVLRNVPEGRYILLVQAEGYLEARRELFLGEPPEVTVDLALNKAPIGRGRVFQADGQPFRNGEVLFVGKLQRGGNRPYKVVRQQITTDAEGRFQLPLEPGRYRLVLIAAGVGYAKVGPLFVRLNQEPKELTLTLRPAGRISGRVQVKETGEPIPGVQVFHHWSRGGWGGHLGPPVETDAEGRFLLPDLPAGQWSLSISGPGFLPASQQVDLAEGEVGEVVLEPRRGATLKGVVLGPDERTPLAGVQVKGSGWRDAQVDETGRFTLENVAPGEFRLTVSAEGLAPQTLSLEIEENQEVPELRVVLRQRGGRITGTVVDVDRHQPLEGATVVAFSREDRFDSLGPLSTDLRLRTLRREGHPFSAQTDAQGRYMLTHVPEGVYTLYLLHEQGPIFQRTVKVREEETTERVDFEVYQRPSGYLTGRLLRPDGQPLAQASARVEYFTNFGVSLNFGLRTDEAGRYCLRLLRAGRYEITFTVEGYLPAMREVAVQSEQEAPEVDFVLEPEPPGEPPTGSLSGRVFLPNSQTPAVGIQVIPFTKDAPFPEANTTASTGGATYRLGTALGVETDENGAFLLEGLRPGRYGVYVTPYADLTSFRREALRPEFANLLPALSELVEVKENEETKDVQVVLKAGGSLAVTVRDAGTNEPVAEARIGLHGWVAEEIPFHRPWQSENTDKEGRCRIDGLLSGTYSVTVTAPNYRMQQPKALVLAGQEQALEVRLERGGDEG